MKFVLVSHETFLSVNAKRFIMHVVYLTDIINANKGFVHQVDMSATMALVMSAKEESEIAIIKKASNATVDVFSKYLKEQIMDIIDRDKKVW